MSVLDARYVALAVVEVLCNKLHADKRDRCIEFNVYCVLCVCVCARSLRLRGSFFNSLLGIDSGLFLFGGFFRHQDCW